MEKFSEFTFIEMDLIDSKSLNDIFGQYQPEIVINLAAQAGVRYSIENPKAYIDSNIIGFFNVLEACKHYPVKHLLFASSSSVYGNQEKTPFSTDDNVDHPISLYAATKKSNELMAYTYSKLYGIALLPDYDFLPFMDHMVALIWLTLVLLIELPGVYQ